MNITRPIRIGCAVALLLLICGWLIQTPSYAPRRERMRAQGVNTVRSVSVPLSNANPDFVPTPVQR